MIARVTTTSVCAPLALVPAARAQAPAAGGAAAPETGAPARPSAPSAAVTVNAMPDQKVGAIARSSGRAPANRSCASSAWTPRRSAGAWSRRPAPKRRRLRRALAPAPHRPHRAARDPPQDRGAAADQGLPPGDRHLVRPRLLRREDRLRHELTPDLEGVAHRSLPCGTHVAFTYAGRTIVVPVIDRGPYGVAGANWDLTKATADILGFTATAASARSRPRAQPAPSR